jgi:hypothetical protein
MWAHRVGVLAGTTGLVVGPVVKTNDEALMAREGDIERDELHVLSSFASHIAVLRSDGVIEHVNEAWESYGRANGADGAKSGVGMNYLAECERAFGRGVEEAGSIAEGIRRVLEGASREFTCEYECTGPKRRRWFSMSVTPMHGVRDRALVAHTDITKRVLAQYRARDQEQWLNAVLNTAPVVVLVLDVEGRVQWANEHLERLTGYSAEDLVGEDWVERMVPSRDRKRIGELCWLIRHGEPSHGELNPIVRKDGGEVTVQWFNRLLKNEHGETESILCIGSDVTEKMIYEESLRAVLDTAAEAIVTIDRSGTIQSFNRAAEEIFGYSAEEVIGTSVGKLMPSPYRETHASYIERYLETGEPRIIGTGREVVAVREDGSKFPAELSVSRVGDTELFSGIVRDMSERRAAEERLRNAERLTMIGTLAAGLGHDMNNLLLPMRMRLDLLDQLELPDIASEQVESIRKLTLYLQDLAEGLHHLALDPEDSSATDGSTDLKKWWGHVQALLVRSVPDNVGFTSCIPAHLPPVAVAPHRLTQAVLNLLVNAGKAVSGADGGVRLWAELEPGGDVVRVCVSDNGVGMSEAVRRRAVEPFFTTKTRGLGTGMGLTLVDGVVRGAGGYLEIESIEGEGTTVSMRFPVSDVTDVETAGMKESAGDEPERA